MGGLWCPPLGGMVFVFCFLVAILLGGDGVMMLGCGFVVFGLVLAVVVWWGSGVFPHNLPTTILELSKAMPTKSALL